MIQINISLNRMMQVYHIKCPALVISKQKRTIVQNHIIHTKQAMTSVSQRVRHEQNLKNVQSC